MNETDTASVNQSTIALFHHSGLPRNLRDPPQPLPTMTVLELPTPDPRTLDEASQAFAEALLDRFAVRRQIGRGGMGVVYLARDRRLDRLVAIKTLPPNLARDAAIRERFLRETRTAGAMAHPNIVPIHGADEVDGHVFFVMTYVDGESLAARVAARGRLDARTAARHLRDVAAALAHAHQRGIIHRDIKAENILIERDTDRALVTDFGIARLAEATPLTGTGQVLGTVHYVSPEQVSGDPVDARSDIYSLGVVGHLALVGRFPFNAEVASAVLIQHVTRTAAPIASLQPDVPPALAAIVDRCLSKDPGHRYASAADLLTALEAAIAQLDQPAMAAPLLSDTEAHKVWRRAAELQAATGIQPRPEIAPVERDAARDAERTKGFQLDEVRGAAGEAGIATRYVDHALGEIGVGPKAVAPAKKPAVAPPPVAERSWWLGVPLQQAHEIEVPGELPARDLERLINLLRDATGTMGHTLAHTRELAWMTGRLGTRLEVTVVPEHDRTTIRVVRDARRSAFARAGGWLVTSSFVIAPLFGVLLHEGLGLPEDVAIPAAMAFGLTLIWKGGRALVRRGNEQLGASARNLAERLAAKVRGSIRPESR